MRRGLRGEDNPSARLTAADVRAIREAVRAGAVQADLARAHDVSRTAVWFIVHGLHWAHLLGAAA